MVSIAAASHSLNALYGVLVDMVIDAEMRKTWREKPERGDPGARSRHVHETIKRAVVTDVETLTNWRTTMDALFKWRDAALHHREETAESVPHPSGTTNSSRIYETYCVEKAELAVDFLL